MDIVIFAFPCHAFNFERKIFQGKFKEFEAYYLEVDKLYNEYFEKMFIDYYIETDEYRLNYKQKNGFQGYFQLTKKLGMEEQEYIDLINSKLKEFIEPIIFKDKLNKILSIKGEKNEIIKI